jgi:hypothetical protein
MNTTHRNYALRTFRFDQLWLPFSLLALFIVIGVITNEIGRAYDLTRIYLSTVMPLVAGILSAYALLDDPVLELKFAAPVSLSGQLIVRLGAILGIQLVTAAVMQGFAILFRVDLSGFGNLWQLQLVWLVPCLTAMAFASFLAFAAASPVAGAVGMGLVWFLQAILHSWFAMNVIARYFFLFMGGLNPGHESLLWNRLTLFGLSLFFLVAAMLMLRRQERYL